MIRRFALLALLGTLNTCGLMPAFAFTAGNVVTYQDTTGGKIQDSGLAAGIISPSVPTNAVLALTPTTASPTGYMAREDYAAGNGAPRQQFKAQGGTCVANSMVNDGGSCVDTTGGNSWKAVYPASGMSVRQWGATNSGDQASKLQAAVTALQGTGVPLLINDIQITINSGITASSKIRIEAGTRPSIYATSCSIGIKLGAANIANVLTLSAAGSEFRGCMDGSGVLNTAGVGVLLPVGSNSSQVDHAGFIGLFTGVSITGNTAGGTAGQNEGSHVTESVFIPANASGASAWKLGASSTGGQTVNTVITGNDVYCTNAPLADGAVYLDAGGPLVGENNIFACHYGTKIFPGSGQVVTWGFFRDILGDTSGVTDLYIDTNDATALIQGLSFNQTWASSSTTAPSVVVQNSASGLVAGVHFAGHRTYPGTNQAGMYFNGTMSDITIVDTRVCTGNNTNKGLILTGSVGPVTVTGSKFSGNCDSKTGTLNTGIDAGSDTQTFFGTIANNDVSNTTTPLIMETGATVTAALGPMIGVDGTFPTVSSATSIALPVNPNVKVTGTTTITTMTGQWGSRKVTIIPNGALPFNTGGTAGSAICAAFTASANVPVIATYSGPDGCWYLK